MPKKIILAVLTVLAAAAVLAWIKGFQFKTMGDAAESMVPPPETVTTAKVRAEKWRPTIAAVGSIAAVHGVTVRAEAAGTVEEIAFESGAEVQKGDLLVQLDVSTEQAELRSAKANFDLARLDLDRARDLQQRKVIAASEWDSAEAKAKGAEAQVQNMETMIAKKTIRAPFSGRLGIRQVNLGQVLEANAEIVSLQAIDEVFADFALPQQRLSEVAVGMEVAVTTDAFPGQNFDGKLTALNSSLDVATRSLPIQATLQNRQALLRPGMFARVEVKMPSERDVLIIPNTAVAYAPYGDSVFVVEQTKNEKTGAMEQTLRSQIIRIGVARGDFVEVTKGLKENEEVVSSGTFKLRKGMSVKVDNTLAPDPQLAPTPADA